MSRNGRVLLIDDQPEHAEGLRDVLAEEGIELRCEASAITLPFAIGRFDPDVILIDLSMPRLSGISLLEGDHHKRLRTRAPMILFSGRDPRELSRLTEQLGADGFLSKSQDASDMLRRIEIWIKQRRALDRADGGRDAATGSASTAAN